MFWVPLLLHRYAKTLLPPFLANKEILAREWGWPRPHQQLDLILHWEERKGTLLVEMIPVHSPLCGWALQQCSSQRTSLLASCSLQAAICPTRKGWLVECSALLSCVGEEWLPLSDGAPGCVGPLNGEMRGDGGTGRGASKVHCTIWNAPRGAVQSSSGPLQMPDPSAWEWQSIRSHNAGCGGEGPHDSSCPCRKDLITRTPGRNSQLAYLPQWITHFRAWGSCPLRRTSPCAEDLLVHGWMSLTSSLGRCSLTSQYTHGAWLDLNSLETLQVIVYHNPMIGEVQ